MSARYDRHARANQGNPVLDRMRAAGWASVAEQPQEDNRSSLNDSPTRSPSAAMPVKHGEGWRLWQQVVDATSEGVQTMASAVKSRVGGVEGLCESDEEDYTGGDTHLTRVIKEYYIDRSTKPDDLPGWLFPERQAFQSRAWGPSPTASRGPPRSHSQSSVSSSDSYASPPPAAVSRSYQHQQPRVRPVPLDNFRSISDSGSAEGHHARIASRGMDNSRLGADHGARTAQRSSGK